jgi:hypothetical protein
VRADVESPEEQAAATTIHRLLEYKPPGGFTRNASNPIDADAVVVDESSMLDISLARELCSALGPKTHLVLIGDPDQLPSIGPGNVRFALLSVPFRFLPAFLQRSTRVAHIVCPVGAFRCCPTPSARACSPHGCSQLCSAKRLRPPLFHRPIPSTEETSRR